MIHELTLRADGGSPGNITCLRRFWVQTDFQSFPGQSVSPWWNATTECTRAAGCSRKHTQCSSGVVDPKSLRSTGPGTAREFSSLLKPKNIPDEAAGEEVHLSVTQDQTQQDFVWKGADAFSLIDHKKPRKALTKYKMTYWLFLSFKNLQVV